MIAIQGNNNINDSLQSLMKSESCSNMIEQIHFAIMQLKI